MSENETMDIDARLVIVQGNTRMIFRVPGVVAVIEFEKTDEAVENMCDLYDALPDATQQLLQAAMEAEDAEEGEDG